jgi:hypothetical protein
MGELESAEENGRPSKKDAWSVAKNSITNIWFQSIRS